MAPNPPSHVNHEQYPEVVQTPRSTFNVYDSSYEYYTPVEAEEPDFAPHRSPAPEYQRYPGSPNVSSASPRISAASPPPPSSGITHSATNSEVGWRSSAKSGVQYSEFGSPDPETVYYPPGTGSDEKESYTQPEKGRSASPAVKRKPVAQPPALAIIDEDRHQPQPTKKRAFYKRPLWIIIGVVIVVVIVIAVVLGVVLGTRKSSNNNNDNNSNDNNSNTTINGDPNLAVGGYLNPNYYSKAGAFNGSGVAVAAANPGVDQTAYVFYQDWTGDLVYKLIQEDGSVSRTFPAVNDQKSIPLNGTPLSIVAHVPTPNNHVYHLFYIDSTYTLVERILQTGATNSSGSAIPVWYDGPLNRQALKTMNAKTIGLQACLWNNYSGNYNNNSHYATDAIHLFYGTSDNQIAMFSWTNGSSSNSYVWDQNWDQVDGHAGVGCNTWDTWSTEYIFFVDSNQKIVMYWRETNKTAPSTPNHTTLRWNRIDNVSIGNVQRSSSLGFTNYMVWQDADTSIRGANITWAWENTTIATNAATGKQDLFTVTDLNTNAPVPAVRGTHLSLTALRTASNGGTLQVYFQTNGSDVRTYTRDMFQAFGKWQTGPTVV